MRFEMYAVSVGWLPPTSVSADWSPRQTNAGGFLWVAVGDVLRPSETRRTADGADRVRRKPSCMGTHERGEGVRPPGHLTF